jgi:uncharacterized protein YndB with AHSA1/START domain
LRYTVGMLLAALGAGCAADAELETTTTTEALCAVTFHAEADIAAEPWRVWDLIVDLEGYADWNPWVVKATGPATPGATIEVDVVLNGGIQHVQHEILVVEPNQRFCWKDAGWSSSLVPAHRCRTLTALPDGTTHVDNDLVIEGLLAPLSKLIYGDSLASGIAAETTALKDESEAP